MFPIGTQISMLMSTASKKLSPRCRSIGYVSGLGRTRFITNDYKEGLVVTPISIVFTRYGNEKRLRKEKRVILNIIPIETYNPKQDVETDIKNLRNNLKKNTAFYKKQMDLDGAVCAGTIIPNNTTNNILENKKIEIGAWIQSHTDHYYFNRIMPDILKRLNYPQKFILQLLKNYSKLKLQDVVLAIRAGSTAYNTRNYANFLITFRQILTSVKTNMHRDYEDFFSLYIKDFFDEEKSIQKEVLVRKYSTNKTRHIAALNMNKISKTLMKEPNYEFGVEN